MKEQLAAVAVRPAVKRHFSTQGQFENLPKWLNLIPMIAQWIGLSLRYRSWTLPSAGNPSITSGGMVGEGKSEYFETMGKLAKSYTADSVTMQVYGAVSLTFLLDSMKTAGLQFPVVVKPNLGWCGYGVRRIDTVEGMIDYLSEFPQGEELMIQRYLPEEGEAGLYYYRFPDEEKGHLMGILFRTYPRVTGNGIDTIAALIENSQRLRRVVNNPLHRANYNPDDIPAAGEIVRLSTIGSTRVGGLYRDGSEEATPELLAAVDAIARDMKNFHVGRFDVRYATMADLRKGEFKIMEVNGAGSESVHAWDPRYTIPEAYRIIFAKHRLLFAIGAANRKRGYKPVGLFRLAALHFHQQKLMKSYPLSN